jgi:prophage antirepressor-like protein
LGGLKGNEKNTIYINEAGLYEFIFSSKKESAEKFK